MANQVFSGFVHNNAGTAINGATVELFPRNSTTTATTSTTTNSSGYWTMSTSTEGRFDVRITNGASVRFLKYDDQIQIETLEVANFNIRNPANTFDYAVTPAAISADRILTLPLLTGTATLIVTPSIEDLDMGGFDIDNAGFLILNAATAPAGTEVYLVNDNSGDLTLNALTGKDITFAVAGTDQAVIDVDGIDLISGNAYEINGTSVLNATTLGSAVVASSLTSLGTQAEDLNMGGFDVDNAGFLILNAATAPAGSEVYLVNDNTGDLTLNALDGKDVIFAINGVDQAVIDADGVDLISGNAYEINGTSVLSGSTLGSGVTASSLTSLGTQAEDLNMGGNNIDEGGVINLIEQADADADVAGRGQIWVNTATPNELYFTDDAGTDFQLGGGGDAAITALNNATANELVTVGATTTELDAESNLTFSGSALALTGTMTISSTLTMSGNVDLGSSLLVGNAGSTGIAISSAGEVTMAAQPAVGAYNSSADDNQTGNGATATIDFDSEVYDQNADFASDTFTAPVTGRYEVHTRVSFDDATSAATAGYLSAVTSNRTWRLWNLDVGSIYGDGDVSCGGSAIVDMDAADTMTITLKVSGESSDVNDIGGHATIMLTFVNVKLAA